MDDRNRTPCGLDRIHDGWIIRPWRDRARINLMTVLAIVVVLAVAAIAIVVGVTEATVVMDVAVASVIVGFGKLTQRLFIVGSIRERCNDQRLVGWSSSQRHIDVIDATIRMSTE